MLAGTRWFITILCAVALNSTVFADDTEVTDTTEQYDPITVEEVQQALEKVTPNFYREPQKLEVKMEDTTLSCVQLDDTIVALEPLTYRVVPGFYDGDIYQTVAFWVGTTNFHDDQLGLPFATLPFDIPLPYAYFGYVAYKRYEESERIYHVSHRISQLRRVKAQKRCFEI